MKRNWREMFDAYCERKTDQDLLNDSIEALRRCSENHDVDTALTIMALSQRLFDITVELEE